MKRFGHEHCLTGRYTADDIIPVISKIVNTRFGRKFLILVLRGLNPFSHKDDIERNADLIETMYLTQEQQFEELEKCGEQDDEFCILTIDQTYMGAGKTPVSFETQIKEIVKLIKKGKKIKMFFHVDCRRPDYINMLKKYKTFISGLKFYNYMGTLPYSTNYEPAYKFARLNNLPCIFHCSRGNINYYRGKDIDRILKSSVFPLYKVKNNNREKSMNFSNPQGMILVAKEHPEINVQIAHLGGYEDLDRFIEDKEIEILQGKRALEKPIEEYSFTLQILLACIEFDNIYTDTSFTMFKKEYFKILIELLKIPKIRKRVIFGTDFPVNKTKADMKTYVQEFKKTIGIMNFDQISRINSNRLFAKKG